MDPETLIERHPWMNDYDIEFLEEQPWLAVFIENGDANLILAVRRYEAAVAEARAELRARGETPHQRMMTSDGLMTTAYIEGGEKR